MSACAEGAARTRSRATARATPSRTARRATPGRSSGAGRTSGCSSRCARGASSMAGSRRRMTGRAYMRGGAVEMLWRDWRWRHGRRRASSRTSSDRGRPPARRRRGRTWRRRRLRPHATTFANRAGCRALSTVGMILPPGSRFDIDAANGDCDPARRRRDVLGAGPVRARVDARPPSRRSSVTRRSLRRGSRSDGGEVLPCPCRVRPSR